MRWRALWVNVETLCTLEKGEGGGIASEDSYSTWIGYLGFYKERHVVLVRWYVSLIKLLEDTSSTIDMGKKVRMWEIERSADKLSEGYGDEVRQRWGHRGWLSDGTLSGTMQEYDVSTVGILDNAGEISRNTIVEWGEEQGVEEWIKMWGESEYGSSWEQREASRTVVLSGYVLFGCGIEVSALWLSISCEGIQWQEISGKSGVVRGTRVTFSDAWSSEGDEWMDGYEISGRGERTGVIVGKRVEREEDYVEYMRERCVGGVGWGRGIMGCLIDLGIWDGMGICRGIKGRMLGWNGGDVDGGRVLGDDFGDYGKVVGVLKDMGGVKWEGLVLVCAADEDCKKYSKRTIDQSTGGKLRDLNPEESWAILEDLALYDNESWNNPRDFAKPVKAIALPQDVPSTFDRRLIELENQVQRLMEACLAPTQSTQVNKITTPCEIYSGPHDT
ncbi:hypothetical protein Tco_0809794 [Tanacetum coccineum]